MDGTSLILVPLLAWTACGLAAVALTPRHGAARALCVAGLLILGSWVLEEAAREAVDAGSGHAVLNAAADGVFFEKTVAIITALLLMPSGCFTRRWHGWFCAGFAALGVVATALRIAGSTSIDVGNETALAVGNTLAVDSLKGLAAGAEVVMDVEPAIFLIGIAILVHRWFAEHEHRREIGRILRGIGALVFLLVLVVLGETTALPYLVPGPLFLLALAAFPVLLLIDLSRQARQLHRDLADSRARIVAAEDEARRALERDLHDGVQQQLVGILTLTELAARQTRRDPSKAEVTLNEVRHEIEDAIGGLRELVRGIRPPALADGGLSAALSDRFGRLPIEVEFDARTTKDRWSPEVEAALYFVACEAVTNAIKHAPGSTIRVHLRSDRHGPVLTVTDNGSGLTSTTAGPGLRGLRDRIESLGGEFQISSSTGGTTISAKLPAVRA